ncbi:MAG: orotidine-5'-phosphate decarboxylase [Planctomycetes bacterium]|jgi:orotidine-5'-phosphate decarboxylase|nr:orotidine-5'-phosphate decarboxylase [Phycisphaerae bacterium]NBB95386.1 orotidine-5'-phosphate decarboxylase [Planctomycetota bacterium]
MSEQGHVADRLLEAVDQKGSPVCVGLDPRVDHLPEEFVITDGDPVDQIEAVGRWAIKVLEVVAPHVPAVKPQIAYFECLAGDQGFYGLAAYATICKVAGEIGLIVVGDAKRGDIGSTAEAYAAAHLTGPCAVDAVTVNPYFGADGLQPFLDVGRDTGRGVFALVRTSNPSATAVQDFTGKNGMTLYEHMGGQIAQIGRDANLLGQRGYSLLGAVVGATYPEEARRLRRIMPQQIFLVPGYGAQGATAQDCAAAFKPDGTGAIVNASRSVIYAHNRPEFADLAWEDAVAQAARDFARDIALAVQKS